MTRYHRTVVHNLPGMYLVCMLYLVIYYSRIHLPTLSIQQSAATTQPVLMTHQNVTALFSVSSAAIQGMMCTASSRVTYLCPESVPAACFSILLLSLKAVVVEFRLRHISRDDVRRTGSIWSSPANVHTKNGYYNDSEAHTHSERSGEWTIRSDT